MAKPLLIVKTGTTVSNVRDRRGDFEDWFRDAMQLTTENVRVVDVSASEQLPSWTEACGILVTGSPAMVTAAADWSENTGAWLREAVADAAPVLGVCYGHQLLAHALGGTVHDNPAGRNIGTVDVELTDAAHADPLLSSFERLHVPVSHTQSVAVLPPQATLLARTRHDRHHAFRLGARCWGVQFHPEFDADIVRGYIDARRDELVSEGLDPTALKQQARDTDDGTRLLRRFRDIAFDAG